jgi:hypothetical protein
VIAVASALSRSQFDAALERGFTAYPGHRVRRLAYPESQLVSLAHSLVSRGVIDETELAQRLDTIRARLEA